MPLGHRGRDRVREHDVGAGAEIREDPQLLGLEGLERGFVPSRRGEVQIHKLERGLDVPWRDEAPQPLGQRPERRGDVYRLAGELLAQRGLVEFADPGLAHDSAGERNLRIEVVGHERSAAGTGGGEEDLVVLEVGGLEYDAHAVLERPHGDPHLVERLLGNDRRTLGHGRKERSVGRRIFVGRDLPPADRGEHAHEILLGGRLEPLLLGRVDEDDAAPLGQPCLGHAVRLGERNPGEEGVHEFHLRLDGGVGAPLQEDLHVVARQTGRFLVLALREPALVRPPHRGLLPLEFRLGEAVAHHALRLGQQRLEPALDPPLRDQGDELVCVDPARELALPRDPEDERRVRLLTEFI